MHEVVIFIAKYFIVFSVLITAAVWLKVSPAEKRRFIVLALLGAIFSLVLAKIGNKLYYDPRPFITEHITPYFSHANDNGFPSDHTLFASFLAFSTWRFSRRAGIVLLVLAALVGLSRVIAGVHHLTDIVGSMIFAFVGVWIANVLISTLMPPKKQSPRPPTVAAE